jgi:molecular chaperone DnaJ
VTDEVCYSCDGLGKVIRSPCPDCEGKGFEFGKVREVITVPKGVDTGVNLRVAKKGNAGDGGPAGDLLVKVNVKPHAYFKRDGANIYSDCFISISQAVLGSEIKIKTLYGDVKMKIPQGT